MSKSGKVLHLKDKIDGNEVDLSLCNLTEVPVKELALYPKISVVDLSCNNITSIPPEFCNLTHLTKVDLSKNLLTCLPDDLEHLVNLQHLDLYNNKLSVLPVSFSQLRSLKWLDLKDNPLEVDLAKAAGDCLDEKQCKLCANKVLEHMREIQEEVDHAREKQLLRQKELERKKEVKQKEKEAKRKEARKREKAEEKEKRRQEYMAQMATQAAQEQQQKKTEEKKKKNGQATDRDIRLFATDNSSEATDWSRDIMRTQYEWLFLSLKVTIKNDSDVEGQDVIIYTINMKRRSILYIVNFLMPVFFFLCLDMFSFMISECSGEKLSFKVTVMLAVTVLQLILNDILPASSNRIPLIAVYCMGIFGFMMISLLETILVMYLMQKDIVSDQRLTENEVSIRGKPSFSLFTVMKK